MSSWTPQQIVDALNENDKELRTLAKQFAWLKGQKDHWKDELERFRAGAVVRYQGASTRAKDYAIDASHSELVEIPWLPDGSFITLPQMVRLTEASFDLVSKEYNRLETSIMILMAVNKNVMQDYNAANLREQY